MKHGRTMVAGTALLASALLVPGVAAQSPAPSVAPVGSPDASPATATGEVHPAHIHAGSCPTPGDIVAPLRDVTAPRGGQTGSLTSIEGVEVSVTRVNPQIPQMLRDPHAINVHLSADDLDTYIACGDITGRRNDRNLVIPLAEQNGSGHRGVAFLQDDGNRTVVFTVLFSGDGTGVIDPLASPPIGTEPSPSLDVPTESLAPLPTLLPVESAGAPATSPAP
jgi:hypothetical protein